MGKTLMYIGLAIALIGFLISKNANLLSYLGHLPGDIRIEKENFRFYFPITTSILLSVIISLLFFLWNKLK